MNKNTILLGPQHDISGFCSCDESRYALMGVHYNAEKKRLEASDGRMVIVLPVLESKGEYPTPSTEQTDLPQSFLIPGAKLREALSKIPARTTLSILKKAQVDTVQNDKNVVRISISTTDLDTEYVLNSKNMEITFPNVEQCFRSDPPQVSINLSPRLLKTIADYAYAHCSEKYNHVKIELWDKDSAARISMVVGEEQQNAVALLMPMRME